MLRLTRKVPNMDKITLYQMRLSGDLSADMAENGHLIPEAFGRFYCQGLGFLRLNIGPCHQKNCLLKRQNFERQSFF